MIITQKQPFIFAHFCTILPLFNFDHHHSHFSYLYYMFVYILLVYNYNIQYLYYCSITFLTVLQYTKVNLVGNKPNSN